MADTDWIPIVEFADGWTAMPDERQVWPRPRARRIGAYVEVQANAQRLDRRDPVPGERIARVPGELLGDHWHRTVWQSETIGADGRVIFAEFEVDEEGWYLVPRPIYEIIEQTFRGIGDSERTDSAPMRDSSSPTGHVCPECLWPLNPDWTGEHREGCTIATWPLPRGQQ